VTNKPTYPKKNELLCCININGKLFWKKAKFKKIGISEIKRVWPLLLRGLEYLLKRKGYK